jgi:hypothetical protein
MRRVRKLCWWVMTVCLGIAVLLSSYFAWDYNAAMGLLGDKPTAVVFFPYAAAALLIVSGVFPPSCSERHNSEDANLLMASVRIYGRPYS